MKGALRVAVLLFTALGLQRLLLWIGGALILLGYLLPLPARGAVVLLGCILPLVPSIFAGGILLRYFVAPRGMQLIPHARIQVLGGMMLAASAVATVAALIGWSFGFDPAALWLRAATLASLVLLTQFPVATSVPGTMGWVLVFATCMQSITAPGLRAFAWSIAQNEPLMCAIVVVAWAVFGIWFMRARAFKAPSDVQPYGSRVFKVAPSHATAIRTFLMGNPSVFYQYSGGLAAVLLITIMWTIMTVFIGSFSSLGDAVTKGMTPALGLGAYAGLGGFLVVRRSKFLWLRGSVDREGLFRLCERQAWRFYGATAVSVVALQILMSLLHPALTAKYAVLMLFHLSAGVCLLYLGLMHVRGWRPLDILCAIGLALGWTLTSGALASVARLPLLPPIAFAILVAVAIAFRLTALNRWRTIDWLVCKAPRPAARGAQQVRWT